MKKGFKPLPMSLKVIFVITALGLLFSLSSINETLKVGSSLFGLPVYGIAAIILFVTMLVACITLLVAMWNRYRWTSKFAYIWLTFGIINTLLGIPMIDDMISNNQELTDTPETANILYVFTTIGLSIGVLLNSVYIYFFYRNRKYFEKQ